ncbi:MAG: DUF4388 domain-containing protein [Planctomycetota bacterium]|jgi:DNA-binding response OmpR family regulator
MSGQKILIVDDDKESREVIRKVLEGADYGAAAAADAEEALRWAPVFQPDLFILDADLPGTEGRLLLGKLRSQPQYALAPFVFLADRPPEEKDRSIFHTGTDIFLQRPVTDRDLLRAVKNALRKYERTRLVASGLTTDTFLGIDGEQMAFKGSLEELRLPTLLTLIETEKLDGILVARKPGNAEKGRFLVRSGRITHAEMVEPEGSSGIESVCRMLQWTSGSFEFRAAEIRGADEIKLSTQHLLLEAARRIDEGTQKGMAS